MSDADPYSFPGESPLSPDATWNPAFRAHHGILDSHPPAEQPSSIEEPAAEQPAELPALETSGGQHDDALAYQPEYDHRTQDSQLEEMAVASRSMDTQEEVDGHPSIPADSQITEQPFSAPQEPHQNTDVEAPSPHTDAGFSSTLVAENTEAPTTSSSTLHALDRGDLEQRSHEAGAEPGYQTVDEALAQDYHIGSAASDYVERGNMEGQGQLAELVAPDSRAVPDLEQPVQATAEAEDEFSSLLGRQDEPLEAQQHAHAEAQYEHQGDNTAADLAVEEAPTSSLLADAQSLSETPGALLERTSDPLDDFGSVDQPISGGQIKSLGWDALDDGDDFGNIIGQSQQVNAFDDDHQALPLDGATAQIQHLGSAIREDPQVQPEKGEEIEDLWAAAFDDDDLLDAAGSGDAGAATKDGSSIDPSGFFDDDDDGTFLQDADDAQQQLAAQVVKPMEPFGATVVRPNQYTYQPASTPYSPLKQAFDPRPAATPSTFLPGIGGPLPAIPGQDQRPSLKPTSSFADRSKAGYASPYDLPTDIVAPRKRPVAVAPAVSPKSVPAPPPRTSSMQSASGAIASNTQPRPPSVISGTSSHSPTASMHQNQPGPQQHSKKSSRDSSGFFADLPMTARPKQRSTPAPAPALIPAPPHGPPQPPRAAFQPPPSAQPTPPAQAYASLQQPARLPLYSEEPPIPTAIGPGAAAVAPPSNRYSPAPPGQQLVGANRFSPAPLAPAQTNRYASAPGPAMTNAQRAHAFIPKTSSPLAYHDGPDPNIARQNSMTSPNQGEATQAAGHRSRLSEQYDNLNQVPVQPRTMTPPQGPPRSASVQSSPRSSRYAPNPASESMSASTFSPTKRPRSHSPLYPEGTVPQQRPAALGQRPSAAYGRLQQSIQPSSGTGLSLPSKRQFSSDLNFDVPQDERSADPLERWKGHPIFHWASSGALISSLPIQSPFYAAGHAIPVLKCTAGPIVVHDTKATFPLHDADDRFPGPLQGKGKGKKKDVVAWLSAKLERMEQNLADLLLDLSQSKLIRQRAEEKVILWKVVRLLVENDNVLEGKVPVDEAVRRLLVANDINEQSPLESQGSGPITEVADPAALSELRVLLFNGQRDRAVWFATEKKLWSHAMLIGSTMGPETWKQLVHEFVKSQVKGQGNNLRSLAALYEIFGGNFEESTDELVPPSAQAGFSMVNITSSLGQSGPNALDGLEKWRETLSLTLSNRSANDGKAIAALGRLLARYGRIEASHTCFLFAKAFATCNGADDPEASFVLLGADHKTGQAALGSDLDSIMLTEVYEYLQSLNPTPGAATVLPHLQPYKLIHAFNLAEHGLRNEAQVYCDSIFTSIKSSTKASPYYHAAFTGAVDDFNRCLSQAPQTASSSSLLAKFSSDKVSTGFFKSFNKFVAGDDDDNASTGSGPGEGGDASGPFGKVAPSPSISRAASNVDLYGAMVSGAQMNGSATYPSPLSPNNVFTPFSQSSPQIPDPATNGYAGRYAPQPAGTLAASRTVSTARPYEPQRTNSAYTPSSTAASRAPSKSSAPYAPQSQESRQSSYSSYAPATKPEPVRTASDYDVRYSMTPESPPSQPLSASLQLPNALGSPYKHKPSPLSEASSPPSQNGYIPSLTQSPDMHMDALAEQHGGYDPPTSSFEPPQASYDPPQASYEPPSASFDAPATSFDDEPMRNTNEVQGFEAPATGYEPPSYQPYEPNFTDEPVAEDSSASKPKKKSFMDLSDDEDTPTARPAGSNNDAVSKAAERAAADRAADAAFRAAAEADAARDKSSPKDAAGKKGWFGGWFGGKKPDGSDLQSGGGQQPQKAIRAKLGEENSFYFDKELGKWVNKKGGQEEVKATATPPPPKGMSRVASAAGGPPPGAGSGPPSRVASSAQLTGMAPPGARPGSAGGPPGGGTPPPGPMRAATPAGLEPPSRPGTGLSNASSIDDLIGPAQGRKGGTVKGKKKGGGRYVDVMAK